MSMSRHNISSPSCLPSTPNDNPDADLETPNDTDRAVDSETTPVSTNRITYPRFLVVEGLEKTLRNVNRTILTKTTEGATSTTTKKQWMGKLVLVEVNHEAYFTNLMKLNQIGDMPVKVSGHWSLNYAKGVVRFKQAAEGLTNEELARDLNMSWRNNDSPQVKETSRVIITKGGKKVQTGTFFLTFDAPTLPEHIFLGFERFDVTPYTPLPRRWFKCQQFGHEHVSAGPLKMCVRCVQELVTNRMIVQTRSLLNAQTVTGHILPPAKNAQHSLLREELSKSKHRLAVHSLQPGSKMGRLLQQNRQQIHMPKS